MRHIWSFLAIILIVLSSLTASADRDIVYSARYYYPPGTKTEKFRTRSREHLYRINPDGTGRKQITHGLYTDEAPLWSPDGRTIYFMRSLEKPGDRANIQLVCKCDPNGEGVRTIYRSPGEHWWINEPAISHDGSLLAIPGTQDGMPPVVYLQRITIINTTGRTIRKLDDCTRFQWSPFDNSFIAEIGDAWYLFDKNGKKTLLRAGDAESLNWLTKDQLIGIIGRASNDTPIVTLDLKNPNATLVDFHINASDPKQKEDDAPRVYGLKRDTYSSTHITTEANIGGSSSGPYNEFMDIDLKTGKRTVIAQGQYLDWDRNRSHYLTSTVRKLVPYGDGRELYMTKLFVRASKSEKWTPIVQGRVWVHSASWRKMPIK